MITLRMNDKQCKLLEFSLSDYLVRVKETMSEDKFNELLTLLDKLQNLNNQ